MLGSKAQNTELCRNTVILPLHCLGVMVTPHISQFLQFLDLGIVSAIPTDSLPDCPGLNIPSVPLPSLVSGKSRYTFFISGNHQRCFPVCGITQCMAKL